MDIKFIDLFAGIGGIRKGLEQAIIKSGNNPICVFTSEIKPYAISILQQNHPNEDITGDITKVDASTIPDFDILCGGFPCQAFSAAGKREGFADTRGTLFFDVERILIEKKKANKDGFTAVITSSSTRFSLAVKKVFEKYHPTIDEVESLISFSNEYIDDCKQAEIEHLTQEIERLQQLKEQLSEAL